MSCGSFENRVTLKQFAKKPYIIGIWLGFGVKYAIKPDS